MSTRKVDGVEPAFIIYKYQYEVMIPLWSLLDPNVVKRDGIRSSANVNRVEQRRLTIAQLATIYSKGVDINYINPENLLEIYNTITRHLNDFMIAMRESDITFEVPVEDLIELDDYASDLWPRVRAHLGHVVSRETVEPGKLSKYMQAHKRFSAGSSNPEPDTTAERIAKMPIEHKARGDGISLAALSRDKRHRRR